MQAQPHLLDPGAGAAYFLVDVLGPAPGDDLRAVLPIRSIAEPVDQYQLPRPRHVLATYPETEALYREDSATVFKAIGAIGAIGLDRDPLPPAPGFYLASGYTEVEIAANGAHRILASLGPRENLCDTLA